jgi:hypothetical protein
MKADIVCDVCGAALGSITKKKITSFDIENYQGWFKCECGGPANLVIIE